MTPRLVIRIGLGYLALVSGQLGLWALLAPKSFFEDFPGLGRSWVAVDGPYNEHLVRDVGALNLALTALLITAAVRMSKELVWVSAIASLLWGVPHLLYHVFNTDGLGGSDVAASLAGLIAFVAFGVALLFSTRHLTTDQSVDQGS
ncbi:MAG: hypothetical protein ACR2QO_03140 [Acidimicrobiales bacterium]